MIAFGGAGPVHADPIARALKMRGTIVPASAGVTSALGFLTAPTSFELARSVVGPLTAEARRARRVYEALEDEGRALLAGAGVAGRRDALRAAGRPPACRARATTSSSSFRSRRLARHRSSNADFAPLFYDRYESVFGHAHRHLSLEIVTCRVTASGPLPSSRSSRRAGETRDAAGGALRERRPVYFRDAGGFVETPAYERSLLTPGTTFSGPRHDRGARTRRRSSAPARPSPSMPFLNLVVTFD